MLKSPCKLDPHLLFLDVVGSDPDAMAERHMTFPTDAKKFRAAIATREAAGRRRCGRGSGARPAQPCRSQRPPRSWRARLPREGSAPGCEPAARRSERRRVGKSVDLG